MTEPSDAQGTRRIRWRALVAGVTTSTIRRHGRALRGGGGVIDPWHVAESAARVDALLEIAAARIRLVRGDAVRWKATESLLLQFRTSLEHIEPPLGRGARGDDLPVLRALSEVQRAALSVQCNHREPLLVSPDVLARLVEALTAIDERLGDLCRLRDVGGEARALQVEVGRTLASARARQRSVRALRVATSRDELLAAFDVERRRFDAVILEAEQRDGPAHPQRPGLRRVADRLAESEWQLMTMTRQLQVAEVATLLGDLQTIAARAYTVWDRWGETQ